MDLWNERDRVQRVVSCSRGGVGEGKRAVRKMRARLNALTVPRMQPEMDQDHGGWGNVQRSPLREDQYGSKMQTSVKEYITRESSYHPCFFLLLHIADSN